MIRLALLIAVLSGGSVWLGLRARGLVMDRLASEGVVVTWARMTRDGLQPVLHDVHLYRKGRHISARSARFVPDLEAPEALLESVEAKLSLAGWLADARLDQVVVRHRRAEVPGACDLEVQAVGGSIDLAPLDTPQTGQAAADTSTPRVCRLDVGGFHVRPAHPMPWPAARVDGTWTPGLLSLVVHPAAGGRLALDLPDRSPTWVHAHLDALPLALIPHSLPATGTVSGEVSLVYDDGVDAGGHLRWQGVFEHPGVAAVPLADLDLRFDFTAHATRDVALLGQARVRTGALDAQIQLGVEAPRAGGSEAPNARFSSQFWSHPPDVQLRAAVAPVDCQAAWRSLPKGLTGPLADTRLAGRMAPTLELFVPLGDPFRLRLHLADHTGCSVTALRLAPEAWPEVEGTGPRDDVDWLLSPFIRRVPEASRPVRVGPGTPGYVPLGRMPRFVAEAAIVSEDPAFGAGHALDLGLIRRALMFNLDRGRFVYGGSTIPQQLVKNLFLTREKTLARKLQEALIALRMAQRLSPGRILELYLNCIEFAPDVYGIQAAARHYFGKSVAALTPKEAAFLAISKPNPRYADALRRRGRTPATAHFREYLRRILQRLVDRGALRPDDLAAAHPLEVVWDKK